MATRRQEKVARVIKEAVSDAIVNLNDPRIEGLISVTRVEPSPDLRTADVFLSMFAQDKPAQNRTFVAINHARSHIQAFVAARMKTKFCPVLHLYIDEKFKKTMEILNIIDQLNPKPQDSGDENIQ